jgi:hypothetical protein
VDLDFQNPTRSLSILQPHSKPFNFGIGVERRRNS